MSASLWYMVIATLPTEDVAREYVAWLQGGHVAAVVAAGAVSGNIVRLDPDSPAPRVMTHYIFPSREVFDRYVAEVAPRLRAEGLERFGPSRGVSFQRFAGTQV